MKRAFEDTPIGVKTRLSVLWIVIMFFYLYNDLFMLMQDANSAGSSTHPSEAALLGFAVVITPPALMPLLSQLLPAPLSRWINIAIGAIYFALIVWTILPQATPLFYRYIGIVENIVTLAAIWTAWRWPSAVRGERIATQL